MIAAGSGERGCHTPAMPHTQGSASNHYSASREGKAARLCRLRIFLHPWVGNAALAAGLVRMVRMGSAGQLNSFNVNY